MIRLAHSGKPQPKPNHFPCDNCGTSVMRDISTGYCRLAHRETLHTLETRKHHKYEFNYAIYKCSECGCETQTTQQLSDFIDQCNEHALFWADSDL